MPLTTYTPGEVLTAASLNDNFTFAALGKVAQVVQATSTTSTTTTSTSYVTTTLTASITPSSNTSKVLVLCSLPASSTNSAGAAVFTLFRGTVAGTNLFTAPGFGKVYSSANDTASIIGTTFLDTPATTSATAYTVGFKTENASSAANTQVSSATSTITLIEVLA